MNARTILNPLLRENVAGMSIKEIREFHLKLELHVSELRIFLKLVDAGKKERLKHPRLSKSELSLRRN